jgi:hypothetical protein
VCTHKSAMSAWPPTAAQKRTLHEVREGPLLFSDNGRIAEDKKCKRVTNPACRLPHQGRDPQKSSLPPRPNAIDAAICIATDVMTDRSARHRTRPQHDRPGPRLRGCLQGLPGLGSPAGRRGGPRSQGQAGIRQMGSMPGIARGLPSTDPASMPPSTVLHGSG